MEFSRKSMYLIITMIFTINVIIRYPKDSHESGQDSILMHAMTQSLVKYSTANWLQSPWSYVGQYPYSYASGGHMVLGGLVVVSGLSIEMAIYYFSLLLCFIGGTGVFMLSKVLMNNNVFQIFSMAFSMMAPTVITLTYWTFTTRNLIIPFFTLILWVLLMWVKTKRYQYVSILLILSIILYFIHNISMLLPLIYLGFFLYFIQRKITEKTSIFSHNMLKNIRAFATIIWFVFIGTVLVFQMYKIGYYSDFNIWYNTQSSTFFSGEEPIHLFLGTMSDFGAKFSIGIVLVPIGLISIIMKKSYRNKPLITMPYLILVISPFLTFTTYITVLMIPILSCLMGWGLTILSGKTRDKIKKKVIVIFFILYLTISIIIVTSWSNRIRSDYYLYGERLAVPLEAYETSLYLKYQTEGRLYCIGISHQRLFIVENDRIFDGGVAGLSSYQIELDPVSAELRDENTLFRYDEMWVFQNDRFATNNKQFRFGPLSSSNSEKFIEKHDLRHFVINTNIYSDKEQFLSERYYVTYCNDNLINYSI